MEQMAIKSQNNVGCIAGLVSVIIPTYNQKDFVSETLDSVLAQDYEHIEIIVTDDGSTDGTTAVIQEYSARYPDRIVPISSENNTGIAANVNRGLARARGEYIAWLGGDDLMLPGKIRKQVALLQSRSDAVGCCHDAEIFESPGSKVLGVFSKLMNGKSGLREGGVELWFDAGYLMLPSTVMIRSEFIPEHGFNERLKYANDWLFDIEVFRHGQCAVINDVLGKYRRHGNNVTSKEQTRALDNEEGMLALSIVDARYPELHHLVRQRRIVFLLAAATKAFRQGDLKRSRSYLKTAIHQGAFIRGPALFVALALFGPYISRQIGLMSYERSPLFIKLSSLLK
jgi:glycosyltransferase involved in cell wall biosynthesis